MAFSFSGLLPSRLNAELRLAQAVSQFEAGLLDDQKLVFRVQRSEASEKPPSIEDVMRVTADIDRQAAHATHSGRGARCVGPRLTNVLQAVQRFAAIGDVMIGGSQNLIACGVWTAVRMTMLVRLDTPSVVINN